jgi:hypothetical protein
MYRPLIRNGYYYDVNALYPYVMMKNNYPVGQTIKFIGAKNLDEIFGIIKCRVTTPTDIYVPILLTQTIDGRVIAPVGT